MKTFYSRLALFCFGISLLLITSCGKDPKTFVPQNVEVFTTDNSDIYQTADALLQADYIFVVDFGFSMNSNSRYFGRNKKDDFLSALYNFVNSLNAQNIDYRIGLINGNVHSNQYSSLANNFLGGIFIDSSMSSSQQNSLLSQLNAIGRPLQRNTNLLLGAAINTMNSQASNFIRAGSQLVYVFVSDTDDLTRVRGLSSRTNASFANKLISYKGNTDFVSAHSIVVGYDQNGDSCNGSSSYGEAHGHTLADVTRRIEGGWVSSDSVSSCILTGNFPGTLDTLARDVRTPTDHFQLQSPGVDPYSIEVYVDNLPLINTQWTYNPSLNSVQISPAPHVNAKVEIRFEQYYQLSGTPNPNRLSVSVNNNDVPQSSSNGWTYNSTYNRIEFHGSYVPNNGDTVKVNYL